jgi:hypothetical protein
MMAMKISLPFYMRTKKMSIKHRIKFKKIDRDRGTSPAELRSSGPKQRPERVATTLGVSGESVRRDVPADEMDFINHLQKFFKGNNDN